MAGGKNARNAQQSRLDRFAFSKGIKDSQRSGSEKTSSPVEDSTRDDDTDPTLKDILAAIQGVKGSLETKIDTVSIDVNLLRTDLRNMSGKI